MRWGRYAGTIAVAALAASIAANNTGPEIWLRLIVVDSAAEAQRLADQVRAGADFAALARERSVDATGVDGGLLGKVDPGTLRQELRDALKSLQPGQISTIVKLPSGYAIVKVLTDAEAAGLASNSGTRPGAVSATGSIRYLLDVDGLVEAFANIKDVPKPDGWEYSPQGICEAHTDSYNSSLNLLTKALAGTTDPMRLMQTHYTLGQLYSYTGEMDKAVVEFEATGKIAAVSRPQITSVLDEALGIAYLHKAEMDNGVYTDPGDRCLFPMRGLKFAHPESSEAAIAHFLKYLEEKPDEIDVKWLLNVAAMTAGKYPDAIPAKYRIPPSAFDSAEPAPHFTDVAKPAGLNVFAMASGVVIDDLDGDGRLDMVTSNMQHCGAMHCFHNNGDGTFSDRTSQSGLANQLGGLNLVAGDYNNDGCLDLLVLRGAWETLGQGKSLLRNNCDGTFSDVTKASGLSLRATNTQSAVWADIDNDGLVDLFVVNEQGPSELYRNRGDGTFEDISQKSGIARSAYSKGVAAADYDGDGYVDFFVSNLNGPGFLYRNNRDGTFAEVARQAGADTGDSSKSFATWFFDYDNDGWPDLFVTSYFSSLEESARTYLGLPHNAGTLKLYRNLGNGSFHDVTKDVGLDRVYMPMGANFGDIDNDGFLDIYLGTGNPSYGSLMPNVLLRNREGKAFVDITTASGTGELHKGHGVAFADLDNDGDQDLFEAIGGAVPGDRHVFRLFENPGNGNDWVTLRLVGTKSNRGAVGAKVKVTVRNDGQTRSVYRTVGYQSSFGGSPLRQHFGLGKGAEVVSVDVWWPGSKTAQSITGVAKNQFFEIKEGNATATKWKLPSYRLGGKNRAR